MTTSDVWNLMLQNPKCKTILKNISLIIELLLIIPLSNADLERFFSHMGIVINDWGSLLKEDTLEALLRIKVIGPPIKDWNNTHLDEAITLCRLPTEHIFPIFPINPIFCPIFGSKCPINPIYPFLYTKIFFLHLKIVLRYQYPSEIQAIGHQYSFELHSLFSFLPITSNWELELRRKLCLEFLEFFILLDS